MKTKNFVLKISTCILAVVFSVSCKHDHGHHSHGHTSDTVGDGHSHYNNPSHQPAFTYLMMNGEFHLNPGDSLSQNDPRNPGRLILETSDKKGSLTKMTFFDHNDLDKKIAECGYQYIGSRPDPHYYPKESKTSIWDIFEKVEDYYGDGTKYKYVLSRSPHGDSIHMHLRYGDNVEQILQMSNDAEDDQFNPWWATYCDIERTTACD